MAASADRDDIVKLLGKISTPHVNRVQFPLNLKSVDYEFLLEKFPAKSELLLKSNPVHKTVPVLIHGDKPICDSLNIVQYIDEAWPNGPSILPSHPYDRSVARFWAAYIDGKWHPQMKEFLNSPNQESKPGNLQKMGEGLRLLEDVFVKSSNGKAFFGGENLGFLDLVLGCFLGWLKVAEMVFNVKILDEAKAPGLAGWAQRFTSHEAVKGTLLETQELLGIYRTTHPEAAAKAEAPKS